MGVVGKVRVGGDVVGERRRGESKSVREERV